MRILIALLGVLPAVFLHAEDQPFIYPQNDAFRQELAKAKLKGLALTCLLYTSPSPRDS